MIKASRNRVQTWLVKYFALPTIVLGVSMLFGGGLSAIVKPGLQQLRQGDMSSRMLAVEALPAPELLQKTPASSSTPALLTTAMEHTPTAAVMASPTPAIAITPAIEAPKQTQAPQPKQAQPRTKTAKQDNLVEHRYFNGRRIRPARTMTMVTTAYSPDERSCGPDARGITASGKTVWTNGMKMVAADTRLLPFGTLVSIPGYYDGQPVPVLDRGGAIKGHRLDLLYPSHERAMQWGKKRQTVTIWEYVD